MKFIKLSDEQAYEAAAELEGGEHSSTEACEIYTGRHPKWGELQIIIPNQGDSIVFGDAFRAESVVIQTAPADTTSQVA